MLRAEQARVSIPGRKIASGAIVLGTTIITAIFIAVGAFGSAVTGEMLFPVEDDGGWLNAKSSEGGVSNGAVVTFFLGTIASIAGGFHIADKGAKATAKMWG